MQLFQLPLKDVGVDSGELPSRRRPVLRSSTAEGGHKEASSFPGSHTRTRHLVPYFVVIETTSSRRRREEASSLPVRGPDS